MADPVVDLSGANIPARDGEVGEYADKEAVASGQFDHARKVVFINGVGNTGKNHAESALALSLLQMCTVVGVYNATVSGWTDLWQCVGDKNQFNGPVSLSARNKVTVGTVLGGGTPAEVVRRALARNPAQVGMFDLLRRPENRRREVFAHSQGNLILSNALQAIAAVDGPGAVAGYTVHTFGSPAVNWPPGLTKHEHAFTFDCVALLAGFDTTFTISKVGMPTGSWNPFTHSFRQYMLHDPAFVVNRFRTGGWGVTFDMDEDGLADALAAMGTNTLRVTKIFEHLDRKHNADADDVAVRYVERVRRAPATAAAVRADRPLADLLVRILDEGWTSAEEGKAIAFLRAA